MSLAPGISAGLEESVLDWRRFSRVTMLGGIARLFGFVGVLIAVAVQQMLEDDVVDSVRDLLIDLGIMALWWVLAGFTVISAVVTLLAAISWRFRRFALGPDGIHLRSGVLMKKHTHLRWDRIQSVDTTQNILARIFRQGTLTVDSAGGAGEKMKLGLLTLSECHALRHAILAVSASVRAGTPYVIPDWQAEAMLGEASIGAAAEAEEVPVYRLNNGRMLGISVLSGAALGGVISLVGAIVMAVVMDGLAAIPLFVLVGGTVWSALKNLAKRWGTRVFLASNGLRVRSGLVTTYAQTIPPGRVHAIEIVQPVLWRRMGWWRVRLTIASSDMSDAMDSMQLSSMLIPAGTRAEVDRMLWILLPDLGVDDPNAFLAESFEGAGGSALYLPAPTRSRLLDPFGWKRNAIALTRTIAAMRWGGFWRRSLTIVWHDHYQSIALTQGPLQRRLNLADLKFRLVGAQLRPAQGHLDIDDAHRVLWAESSVGKIRRATAERESLEAWRARVMVSAPVAPGFSPAASALVAGTASYHDNGEGTHEF